MRFRASTRAAAFAVAVMGFVGSMTGIAWAPKNLSVQVIEAPCEVKTVGSGSFLGSVTLTGFTMVKDQLTGVADVNGTCTLASGAKTAVRGTGVLVPLSILELSCDDLTLRVLSDLTLAGTTVKTANLDLFLTPGTPAAQARYCAAERLASTHSVAAMLTPLSQLLFR